MDQFLQRFRNFLSQRQISISDYTPDGLTRKATELNNEFKEWSMETDHAKNGPRKESVQSMLEDIERQGWIRSMLAEANPFKDNHGWVARKHILPSLHSPPK